MVDSENEILQKIKIETENLSKEEWELVRYIADRLVILEIEEKLKTDENGFSYVDVPLSIFNTLFFFCGISIGVGEPLTLENFKDIASSLLMTDVTIDTPHGKIGPSHIFKSAEYYRLQNKQEIIRFYFDNLTKLFLRYIHYIEMFLTDFEEAINDENIETEGNQND